MSKASEWAGVFAADLAREKAALAASHGRRPRWQSTSQPRFALSVTNAGDCYFSVMGCGTPLPLPEALEAARWIIATFGEEA